MKIYISGKITGLDPKISKEYFDVVKVKLIEAGHNPINPWEILPYHPDHTWKDYMAEDLKVLMSCDAIIMLDNWTDSKGAKVEHALAEKLGLQMFYCKNHNFF